MAHYVATKHVVENLGLGMKAIHYAETHILESIIQYCKIGPFTDEKMTVKQHLLTAIEPLFTLHIQRKVESTIQLLSLLIWPHKEKKLLESQRQANDQLDFMNICLFELEVLDYLRRNLVCDLKYRTMREDTTTIQHMYIEYWRLCDVDLGRMALATHSDVLCRNLEYLVDLLVDQGLV